MINSQKIESFLRLLIVELVLYVKNRLFLSGLLIFGWSAKAQEVSASDLFLTFPLLPKTASPVFQELISGGLYRRFSSYL